MLLATIQYIIRDILQFDKTLDAAMERINSSRRTCALLLGVGDGKVIFFITLSTNLTNSVLELFRSITFWCRSQKWLIVQVHVASLTLIIIKVNPAHYHTE